MDEENQRTVTFKKDAKIRNVAAKKKYVYVVIYKILNKNEKIDMSQLQLFGTIGILAVFS